MERDYLAEAFRYADDPRLKGEPHILALVQRIREQDAEMERLRKDLRECRELCSCTSPRFRSTWHPDGSGKPGPIFVYPGEQIEVHGPDDADVIGTLEMNQRGQLGFFHTDGIMHDLSGTLPLDTIFAEILRCRAAQDAKWGGPEHDDTHTRADWCQFIQKFRNRAELVGEGCANSTDRILGFEQNMIHIASLAIAALESSRRKRAL